MRLRRSIGVLGVMLTKRGPHDVGGCLSTLICVMSLSGVEEGFLVEVIKDSEVFVKKTPPVLAYLCAKGHLIVTSIFL